MRSNILVLAFPVLALLSFGCGDDLTFPGSRNTPTPAPAATATPTEIPA